MQPDKLLAKRLGIDNLCQADRMPKYFEIETIRDCNAKCSMCTVGQWDSKKGKMSNDLFNRIVKETALHSDWIETICLSRNGEPLLDNNISNKIIMLKENKIKKVSFSTNASLLSEKKAIELLQTGLDEINFSIDGTTKETFESIRIGLNFEKVVNNCLRFIELRNQMKAKTSVRIRMVLQDDNKHERDDFINFWVPKVSSIDSVYSKIMHSWGNQLDDYKQKKNPSIEPCISPWSTMIVHYDGKVPLCGCDFNNKHLMGDLNSATIAEIWKSPDFKETRNLHIQGNRNNIELCTGCNIWDLEVKEVYS
ncbi:hypothetical protein LCGC14_2766870 [marine sediment metagenome]|uniref:Radical SAM core domain-containing protein n=1 Tax=marine sediment metagenome TaxID=412755 RepID=A0A0F8ZJ61_9ZZZZ